MKRFDLLYYLFILASMALSAIQAPAMFIQQNALAGWLWILVFIVMLFFIFSEAIDKATVLLLTAAQTVDGNRKWDLKNYATYDWYDDTDTIRENRTYGDGSTADVNESRRNHFRR